MTITVWVQLLRGGKGIGTPSKIEVNDGSDVDDLRDAVKVKFSNQLQAYDAAQLNVSTARESNEYLRADAEVKGIPTTYDKPLFVHVPALAGGSEQVAAPLSQRGVSAQDAHKQSTRETSWTTPSQQAAASSLIKIDQRIKSFGYLPACARFDPTEGARIHQLLVPTSGDIERASRLVPFPICGEHVQLSSGGEEKNVSPTMKNFLASVAGLQAEHSLTKPCLGVGYGMMDNVWVIGDHQYGGDAEGKGGESSMLPGLRQCAIYASTMALERLVAGHALEEVVIPFFSYNGSSVQFGATYLLPPSFPVAMTVSKALDICDPEDSIIARAFLQRATEAVDQLKSQSLEPLTVPRTRCSMQLGSAGVHVKVLDSLTVGRGLGLFCPSRPYEDQIASGLNHLMPTLNALYQSAAREFVVFPLSVRSPGDLESRESPLGTAAELSYWLIFRDIRVDGYRMGTPPRHNSDLYHRYLTALRDAVSKIHNAGVVHLDLYPSNIFWKAEQNGVTIKIIDWDVAHLLTEQKLCQGVASSRRGGHPRSKSKLTIEQDTDMIAVLADTSDDNTLWTDLCGENKVAMDESFFKMLADHGSVESRARQMAQMSVE